MSQNQNNINQRKRKSTIRKGYILAVIALGIMLFFVARLITIQNTNVKEIEEKHINTLYREETVQAARGNLFASDGSMLATTVIKYNVFVDFKIIKDNDYQKNIGLLTDSLQSLFGKTKQEYRSVFDKQKNKQNQYFSLATNLDFDQISRLKRFPIFSKYDETKKEYRKSRCLIIEPKYKRILATNQVGSGTIGIDDERGKKGFEGGFSEHLSGKNGTRWVQKVNAKQWKPIDYWRIQEPVDGNDVYTTLDLRIQDIAYTALEKQLKAYDAKHGSVVVMEVETGKVRAMVNLRKNDKGNYVDDYNYAIMDNVEPGSTFKVVSLLAGMDDGYINENTTVDMGNGTWTYAGKKLVENYGGGKYEISDVLAKSSNIGTAKLIVKHYAAKPEVFFDHLKRWKLYDKLDIEIPKVSTPSIITPKHKKWNAGTLASLSYGYASEFNLLHLTTFYNGIANKGKMVKPLFIDKIMKDGQVLYEAKPQVLVEKMTSQEAIEMMTKALTKAVEKGTAKSIFTPNLKMAGKTGTTRFEYWKAGPMKYRASFAGFYPSDNPKYTCYVMITEPDVSKGYYGGTVSAPVFKEIAGKTFLKTPQNIDTEMLKNKKVDLSKYIYQPKKISINNSIMPEMKGLIGRDVIPQLENAGYRVSYKGVGRVIDQLPTAGTPLKKNQRIYLTLQN